MVSSQARSRARFLVLPCRLGATLRDEFLCGAADHSGGRGPPGYLVLDAREQMAAILQNKATVLDVGHQPGTRTDAELSAELSRDRHPALLID
jgi:hypothetical protein